MILYVASVIICIFICFNLFFRLDWPLGWKAFGCVLTFLASSKYVIYRFAGGSFFAPQLPRELLIFLEAVYGAFMILFFLLLLWDLYLLGNYILLKAGLPVPRKLPVGSIKIGLVCLALALGGWGTWQSIKVPDVRTVRLEIATLPADLNGLKVVQLTDIHIGPILKRTWLEAVVDQTNALDADLILLTGDYVDGHVDEIGKELLPLAGLKARYGVFAVHGNHEYYWNMPEWRQFIGNMGIDLLENEHRALKINGETVVIAGLTDLAAERFGMPMPDLAKTLRGAPEAVRILLSHQPKFGREYAEQTDLILSGHTHGGMMFFLQPLIARFNSGFIKGLYQLNGGNIYVSSGTGLWSGLSCRIGAPAEITLFVLCTGAA